MKSVPTFRTGLYLSKRWVHGSLAKTLSVTDILNNNWIYKLSKKILSYKAWVHLYYKKIYIIIMSLQFQSIDEYYFYSNQCRNWISWERNFSLQTVIHYISQKRSSVKWSNHSSWKVHADSYLILPNFDFPHYFSLFITEVLNSFWRAIT